MPRRARLVGTVVTATVLALAAAGPAPAAAPAITYTLTGLAGDADWFRGPVTVKWTISGETSSSGCDTQTIGTDTPGTTRSCSASNADGTSTTTTRAIRIDRTAPGNVGAHPARAADSAGWYTRPVGVTWSGTDATSGIASCTSTTYAGPDTASASLSGTCRDRAGNESGPATFALAYDATAPALGAVAQPGAPTEALVRWTTGADAQKVTVVREPGDGDAKSKTVFDGAGASSELVERGLVGGRAYTWTVSARDAAGNTGVARATATPDAPPPAAPPTALTPFTAAAAPAAPAGPSAAGAKPAGPRVLRWKRRAGASYYNVQLLRRKRKILSAWPTVPRYALRTSWRYRGRLQRLVPGTYVWYVWPGYGKRSAHRYGRLLARGTFTVR